MGPDSIAVAIPFGAFAMTAAIVYFVSRENQEKARLQAESRKQLLDKFTSSAELTAFLESPNGRRLLENLGGGSASPKERTLKSLKAGVVLTVLGLGLFALMVKEEDMIFPAVITFSLGLGFLLAAALSARVSKNWGLIEDHSAPSASPQPYSS
jgi:hypothetical protein